MIAAKSERKKQSVVSKVFPTLIAVVLATAGGVYVYKYESGEMTDREKAESVLVQDKDAISKIVVKNAKATITFEKDKKDWKITSPLKVEPDSMKMDDLLGRLAKLDSKRLVDDKTASLSAYGLDKPAATVEYVTQKGTASILVGNKSDVESSYYVKRSDSDKLFLVDTYNVQIFQDDFNSFRDKRIVKVESGKATQVKLVTKSETRAFKRADKEKWVIVSPLSIRANPQTIQTLLNALDGLRAEEFVNDAPKPADLASYGLDKPECAISVTFEKDEGTRTLLIGKKKDQDASRTYVKRDTADNVYAVNSSSLLELSKPIEDFKDPKVFDFSATKIKKITVVNQGRTAQMERDAKGNWTFVSPQIKKEAHTAITILAGALENLKAKSYTREDKTKKAEYKLDPFEVKISFEGEAIPPTTLAFGQAVPDKGRYIRIGEDPFLVVPEDDPTGKAISVVNAYMALADFTSDSAQTIKVTKASDTLELKKDDKGEWSVISPKGTVLVDPKAKVNGVLDALSTVGADEFLPTRAGLTSELRLDSPEYKVTVGLKGAPELVVEIGQAVGNRRGVKTSARASHLARVSGPDLIAKLSDLLSPFSKPPPAPAASGKPVAVPPGAPAIRPPDVPGAPPGPVVVPPTVTLPSAAAAFPGAPASGPGTSLPHLGLTIPSPAPSPKK